MSLNPDDSMTALSFLRARVHPATVAKLLGTDERTIRALVDRHHLDADWQDPPPAEATATVIRTAKAILESQDLVDTLVLLQQSANAGEMHAVLRQIADNLRPTGALQPGKA